MKTPITVTAEEAVKVIKSGDSVFMHSVASAPSHLIEAMVNRASELRDVTLLHIHTEGPALYANPEYQDNFKIKSFFIGSNVRQATREGRADYIPAFLSEIPKILKKGIVPVDVALVSVSPPDQHGFVSLGTSVDISLAAMDAAKIVIGQVNRFVPRTLGDASIPVTDLDFLVYYDAPIPEILNEEPSKEEVTIGQFIASLVPDGATLQMGIGSIPNAVLSQLQHHRKLGVHTEMFSDGLIPLIESGVVTNEKKKIYKGHVVSSFVMGSRKLYDFIDNNPRIYMMDIGFVNKVEIIRQNPKVTAINSAIEIDLTGQVCSDSVGTMLYSGVGGQFDFIQGAASSDGGKPIIAITSRTAKGISKIAPTLKLGAGVVTTRANVHFIVTEYGIADLYGKSLQERAKELIRIAHPEDREMLDRSAFERWPLGWKSVL